MTTDPLPRTSPSQRSGRSGWGAVLLLMATSFTLVVAEFLPPGLLTPMALALGITEGQAGQAVAVTALSGFVVAPVVGILFPRLDRRMLLVGVTLVAALSNVLVAVAPSFWLVLVARLVLGAAISGFWAMALSTVSRLVPPERLGRGLMFVNGGTAVATVAGVPLAVSLGSLFDWRVVFVATAALSVLVAALLLTALPSIRPMAVVGLRGLADTLRVRGLRTALAGHVLTMLGHFAAFTFIRLAFERVHGVDANGIALLLALFGIGGLASNIVGGLLVDTHLGAMRFVVPALIALGIAIVAFSAGQFWADAIGSAIWGTGFGPWLLVVNTWVGRLAPDRMEAAGGLVVAGFQIAITLGAASGGLIADSAGVRVMLAAAAAIALVGGALFRMAKPAGSGCAKARTSEVHAAAKPPSRSRSARQAAGDSPV